MKNRITASFIGKFRWVSEDKFVNPEDLYKTLTILPGEENTIVFAGQERKGKVFDNGGDDSLLDMETYTLTSASDTGRHYEYIFTEDFFNNGKPIE